MIEERGLYNSTVMEHLTHPRNKGEMEDPDGVGEAQNPVCGDTMRLFIKVDGDRIVECDVSDFWMRGRHCFVEHDHRNDQRKDDRRGPCDFGSDDR